MNNIPKKIIVHHTADMSMEPQLQKVNEYHKSRDFPISSLGFFVGYHYLIEKNGDVIQTRQYWEEGAHTIGMNMSSIGVCLAGDFDVEYPTNKQMDALGALLNGLLSASSLSPADIVPHRKYANKDCYGTMLEDTWAAELAINHANGALMAGIKKLFLILGLTWKN